MSIADDRQHLEQILASSKASLSSQSVDPGALKRLLLEFRQRLVAALRDMLPSTSAESRTLLVDNMDRGRRSFGRVFHAALFLYQKLRALVPTELHESLHDPLSPIIPFPFYVLPYKAQHAFRSLTALSRGAPKRTRSSSP